MRKDFRHVGRPHDLSVGEQSFVGEQMAEYVSVYWFFWDKTRLLIRVVSSCGIITFCAEFLKDFYLLDMQQGEGMISHGNR
jgi:hypothetical protein